MTILDVIKNRVLKMLGVEKLGGNPNSERYTFISNEETVKKQHLDEYRVWYIGDSDELLNFYLNREVSGNAKEPIYNRNKRQYFWGLSEKECSIKRVHTGIPRASITTLVNLVGNPDISSDDIAWDGKPIQEKIDDILEVNDFKTLLNQQARPLTLVEGDGAFKITFDTTLCKTPLIQYYEAQDIELIKKQGIVIGIIYKDYYKYQDKNYILLETRRVENGNSLVEFELFKYTKSNEAIKVALNTIPELSELPETGYKIEGVDSIIGVFNKYFHDPLDKNRGLSVLAGKIDIADDMDQLASVESLTEKNSGPVEYYPVDLLKRNKNGMPVLPKVFGRTYVAKPTIPGNGDVGMEGKIDTSAPQLNFAQYSDALVQKTNLFLSGWLSPASMGNNLARNDNALAQREKEKVSIFTRDSVMAMEDASIKKLMKLCLMMQEYMDTGVITIRDYIINVRHKDNMRPGFDALSNTLLPLLQAKAISPEEFVDRLYNDEKSTEDKEKEVEFIKSEMQKDDFDIGALMNEGTTQSNIAGQATEEENAIIPE